MTRGVISFTATRTTKGGSWFLVLGFRFKLLMLLLLHCPIPRETRQVGRDKPEGRRARCATFPDGTGTYLPEIPDQLSNPTRPHALGAAQGGFLLVTFLCRSKKSDSRNARNVRNVSNQNQASPEEQTRKSPQ